MIRKITFLCLTIILVISSLPRIYHAEAAETNHFPSPFKSKVDIRLLGTTDIHTHLSKYDYYQDKEVEDFGLAKTATLIKEARAEESNSFLFDNGDLIQGNPLGDYKAKINPIKPGELHPVFQAMKLLDYDAATVGNHEFNYGLSFLNETLNDAPFPYVNSNVYHVKKGKGKEKQYFQPYKIIRKIVRDERGFPHLLNIGVTGVVTPQITEWDRANLEGKVYTKDIVQSVKETIPKMKRAGADLVIVLAHSGMGTENYTEMDEDATYALTKVKGIDAIISGHNHKLFPGDFSDLPGVNEEKGTINGVPVVMPGNWGNHLGVIDLSLTTSFGHWKVNNVQSELRSVYNSESETNTIADPDILDAIQLSHEQTLEYVRQPVGNTTANIHSYFALIKDDPSIQIVTNAQKWYLEKQLAGTPEEGTPILSAGAPFKAGGRNGANYYTYIPEGTIAIKNVADLYLYPNTVAAIKVTGADIKEWLEMSAGQFNQILPGEEQTQPLINEQFPTYNFDVIDGVTYEIDVTEPAKYDTEGKLINENANRIKGLSYNGSPINLEQNFIVATNNYRASGQFPGVRNQQSVTMYPDENRQVIIDYILEQGTIDPTADNNWTFTSVLNTPNIQFESSIEAKDLLNENSPIQYIGPSNNGFGLYSITIE
ncbi:bifunctional 2',3'-cyclic-nucleotide 2'-phosphodiesterase/3'-nucleotidase [Cytobacillus kochii]|uniref:bifunctional 2',3'-cyclic-nucleotide 2'-phosphodiesterase/3'-nucleotidase n=1 Tax=Cytobacillus kochii TaxID=859143 RepID=UPI001CD6B8B1|nr:bifunctional 2',3'-cyclic-nucleotide 2'-phosphodiesterase/3'-nucleotidase [Cytobacillus kochii]MCA1024769.1 bifunctional 2',3'-cyclic-nucleotide 2'-phosphodiesterase/3'-nucleotidase [Cytobacillus kochii]